MKQRKIHSTAKCWVCSLLFCISMHHREGEKTIICKIVCISSILHLPTPQENINMQNCIASTLERYKASLFLRNIKRLTMQQSLLLEHMNYDYTCLLIKTWDCTSFSSSPLLLFENIKQNFFCLKLYKKEGGKKLSSPFDCHTFHNNHIQYCRYTVNQDETAVRVGEEKTEEED